MEPRGSSIGPALASVKEGPSLKRWTPLEIMVQGGAIIVTIPSSRFRAVYHKPHGHPQLVLRERTKTDDHELLSEASKAANDKARELEWIL
jgi:hypothetical protein